MLPPRAIARGRCRCRGRCLRRLLRRLSLWIGRRRYRIIPDLPTAPERTNQRDARAQAAGFQCELVAPGLQCSDLRDGDREIVNGALAVALHREVELFLCGVDALCLVAGGVEKANVARWSVYEFRTTINIRKHERRR